MFRGLAFAILSQSAVGHPSSLGCGDARFASGNTDKCMTLTIEDADEHPGVTFEARPRYTGDRAVTLTVGMKPWDSAKNPYGMYFAIHASTSSSDSGSFTQLPETVAQKDNVTCTNQVHSAADDTLSDDVSLTWTPGEETCGEVTFSMLWGNGPGDDVAVTPPDSPFLRRTSIKVQGKPCGTPAPAPAPAPDSTILKPYPGYTGDLKVTGYAGAYYYSLHEAGVWFDMAGLEVDNCKTAPAGVANACGIHIHEGMTCDDAAAVGGHYYNKDSIDSDPWSPVTYTVKEDGTASGNIQNIEIGEGQDIAGRALVVHDSTGARVACALLPVVSVV